MKKIYKDIIGILLIILILINIFRLSNLTSIFCTILYLISPLFFGYIISWILKPLIDKIKLNKVVSTVIVYLIFLSLIAYIIFNLVPLVIKEAIKIYPIIKNYINENKWILKIYNYLNIQSIINNNFNKINSCLNNILGIIINIIYSLIIGFYFLSSNNKKDYFKFFPSKLRKNISRDLRLYIRSILLDTLFMFTILSVLFSIVKLNSPLLFALLCAITNIIPYIGPYIGGIPAILIGLSTSFKLGIIVTIIIISIQIIENSFIQPLIISKNVKINPICILVGLIVFSHFIGILGMIISTPIILTLKNIYNYYKKNKPNWFNLILDKL